MKTRFKFEMGATSIKLPMVTSQAPVQQPTCDPHQEFLNKASQLEGYSQPQQAPAEYREVSIPSINIEGDTEYSVSELAELWGLGKQILEESPELIKKFMESMASLFPGVVMPMPTAPHAEENKEGENVPN